VGSSQFRELSVGSRKLLKRFVHTQVQICGKIFMGIGYRDFFPAVIKSGFLSKEFEELAATVERANEWIASTQVQIINVETVVLPNIQNVTDAGKEGIRTSGDVSSYWYQVVRVWYRVQASDKTE
jgi:hypothetical protein